MEYKMGSWRKHNVKTRVALSTLAFVAALLVFTTPAYAADNTVSVRVDPASQLTQLGGLYKSITNVTVTTSKPYGFNLVMQTATESSDLINSSNSSRHIYGASYRNMATELSANQWGYALNEQTNKFIRVPSHNDTPAVITDVTKAKPAGCTNPANCTKQVTFAANVDPAKLASGSYSTAIIYTATAKPKPEPVVESTTCRSGDPNSDCQVDLDSNMIPVIYTGNAYNAEWTSIKWPENPHDPGAWYNYNQKKWANAVTVRNPSKYKGERRVVDKDDILGFWVYIPRYAYEVMRRDGTDAAVPAQNFLIHFEKTTDPKRYPAACNTTGKDYRTQCDFDRDYIKGQPSNQGTWATHPAFTFGSKELNGIWFAKFETTGTSTQPTVLPNERAMSWDTAVQYIGGQYVTATTFGVKDPWNTGGNYDFTPPSQNSHHLAELSSRLPKNTDWGAVAYLSASQFGAGYNGVQPNAAVAYGSGDSCDGQFAGSEGRCSRDITGCGPISNGNGGEIYIDPGGYGQQDACSRSNSQRAYNGYLGQLASTTNNPTGVYDMAGGGWEHVAAAYTNDYTLTNTDTETTYGYMLTSAHKPYVDLYNFNTFAKCTWAMCGGQGTYETTEGLYNNSHGSWNGLSSFAPGFADSRLKYYWATRGSFAWGITHGWYAGIFFSGRVTGCDSANGSMRVVLSSRPD